MDYHCLNCGKTNFKVRLDLYNLTLICLGCNARIILPREGREIEVERLDDRDYEGPYGSGPGYPEDY